MEQARDFLSLPPWILHCTWDFQLWNSHRKIHTKSDCKLGITSLIFPVMDSFSLSLNFFLLYSTLLKWYLLGLCAVESLSPAHQQWSKQRIVARYRRKLRLWRQRQFRNRPNEPWWSKQLVMCAFHKHMRSNIIRVSFTIETVTLRRTQDLLHWIRLCRLHCVVLSCVEADTDI